MSMTQAYPEDWARLLDFITPLNIQQSLDGDLELNYFKGEVSVSMPKLTGQLKPQISTNLGVSIEQDHISRRKTFIKFGTLNDIQKRLSQKELWQEILENTIIDEVPAVVGKQRGIVESLSPKLQTLSVLDGCEEVYRLEMTYGHFTNIIRRRIGLPVINPCATIRNDLTQYGYLKYSDPIFQRMRSIWRTEWLIATPVKGWRDLGFQGISDISTILSQNKFHQDVGIPQEIKGTMDSMLLKEQIYRLLKRGELIAIG